MAYCVKCGVELAPSEKVCPLCNTEVVVPGEAAAEPKHLPYPKRVEMIMTRVDRRYGVWLASMLLMIPIGVCVIGNLLISGTMSWSWYVVGGIFVVFVTCLWPFLASRWNSIRFAAVDTGAVILYLALIDMATSGRNWFLPLALPLALAGGGVVVLLMYLMKKEKLNKLTLVGAILISTGLYTVLIQLLIRLYTGTGRYASWSWFAFLPCFIIGWLLFVVNRKQKLRDEIIRRLFV